MLTRLGSENANAIGLLLALMKILCNRGFVMRKRVSLTVSGGFSVQLVDSGRSSCGVIRVLLVEELESNEVATEEFNVIEDWATIKGVASFTTGSATTTCVKGQACQDCMD